MASGPVRRRLLRVRAVTDPEGRIPNNGGCFRPIAFHLPEGSLVNPREPAPTGCRTSTIKRITTCILGALRQAAPDRVPADSGSEIVIMHFGGQRSDGRRYVTSQLLVAGSGASPQLDGVDVIETDASNCLNVPAEALMMEAPIRVHRVALNRDSGGPGTHRGGLGGVFEYELLDGEATVTYRGERHLCEADGVADGMAGGRASAVIRRAGGRRGSGEIEDRVHAAQGRSHGDRYRRRRWLWHAGGARSGIGAGGSAQRQGQPGGGARVLWVSRQCLKRSIRDRLRATVQWANGIFLSLRGAQRRGNLHRQCATAWEIASLRSQ